ncbi:MAG: hypothetical protein ACLR8Y_00915 [Alistipes indistinctus]
MTRVFAQRILSGKSPFTPDKRHIHHKFLQLGYTHLQCTLMIVLIQAVYIVGNFLLADRVEHQCGAADQYRGDGRAGAFFECPHPPPRAPVAVTPSPLCGLTEAGMLRVFLCAGRFWQGSACERDGQ